MFFLVDNSVNPAMWLADMLFIACFCCLKCLFDRQALQYLVISLTFHSHIVLNVFCPSFVSRLTPVHTHILLGELWDVQVRLSAGCVSERLAILTVVRALAAEGEADRALLVTQVQIPEDKQDLVPRFVVTLHPHVAAQVEGLISDNWKGQEWT